MQQMDMFEECAAAMANIILSYDPEMLTFSTDSRGTRDFRRLVFLF